MTTPPPSGSNSDLPPLPPFERPAPESSGSRRKLMGVPRRWVPAVVVGAVVGAAAAVIVPIVVSAANKPDEATLRACRSIAQAEDNLAMAVYLKSDILSAVRQYPALAQQASDAALSGPDELAARFEDVGDDSVVMLRMNGGATAEDIKTIAAYEAFVVKPAVTYCRDHGVQMRIHNQDTGELE